MEKQQEVKNNQFRLKLDTKGNIEIISDPNISPESSKIIREAFQQAEYYRLKAKEETASINEQTFILSGVFILALTFMILSITNAITGSFKNHSQPIHNQSEEINYVRK